MALGNKLSRVFGMGVAEGVQEEFAYKYSEPTCNFYESQKFVCLNGKRQEMVEKKIALFEPRIYSDVKTIATRLLNEQAAVINFQRMDDEQARRVVDFLTGTVFAIEGEIQRVGDNIFLCTPRNFVVEGNVTADFSESDLN
ncbi:MAG: cell division protein SepF [Liquorilactobacillus satsumensis]